MLLNEISRIYRSVLRSYTDPKENPMSIFQMSLFYIKRLIYLRTRQLPPVSIPFPDSFPFSLPPLRIAVIVHCYYVDLMDEMLHYITNIPFGFRLYVSTDTNEKREIILREINKYQIKDAVVKLAPNRGRDIAPKYITFRSVYDDCDCFLHLHSKKSPHTGSWGDTWRGTLFRELLGTPEIVRANLQILADPRIGLVFPIPQYDTIPALRWGKNFETSTELARRMGAKLHSGYCPDYPSGSMFWGKPDAIAPILDLKLRPEDFPDEKGQMDGELQHAIERLVGVSALRKNLACCRIKLESISAGRSAPANQIALTEAISAHLAGQQWERLRYDKIPGTTPGLY